MDDYLGMIKLFAGSFAPKNWALCNGQLLNIVQNSALFSILGTTYGGNGTTTFALPDLRGRTPVCYGQAFGPQDLPLGAQGGTEAVTLLVEQIPAHTHILNASTAAGHNPTAAKALLAVSNGSGGSGESMLPPSRYTQPAWVR
jgi:microcystin-dependent protein